MPVLLNPPVNLASEFNHGLKAWYMQLPAGRGGGGRTFRDLMGRYDGTLVNMDGADWVGAKGRPGGFGALDFDGDNDYLNTNHAFQFGAVDVAFSFWVQTTEARSVRLFGEVDDGDSSIWSVGLNMDKGANFSPGETFFQIRGDDSRPRNVAMSYNIYDGSWYHILVQRIATSSQIFVNGIEQSLSIGQSYLETGSTINMEHPMVFGALNARELIILFSEVLLDDIRIYTRSLSETEASALFHESSAGYPHALNWQRSRRAVVQAVGNPWYYNAQQAA